MRTIHATGTTGSDGVLTLHIPLGRAETEFEVVVVAQAKPVGNGKTAAESPFAVMDAIRNALAATGRDFGDSALEVREDRDAMTF